MRQPSSPTGWGLVSALLAGIAIASVLMLTTVIAHEATPKAEELSTALVDRGCAPVQECQIQHGNIFFGRAVEALEIGKAQGELPASYVIYTVEVEQSLRQSMAEGPLGREASGRVQIKVSGINLEIEDNGRKAPLILGQRYLFFAGLRMDQGYLVDAEIGFLPVADDKEAAELTAELLPLVQQSQREEQAVIARAAVADEPRKALSAEIRPARGPAGSEVVITGSGFTPDDVLLLWDENNPETLPSVEVQPDGEFEIAVLAPREHSLGSHTLSVEGPGSDVVELVFVVEE